MATNAVAMPAAVWKKRRRDRPFFGIRRPSAFMRASTFSAAGLRHRHEFVARHDLRRHRRRIVGQSGRGNACRSSSLNMPMAILQGLKGRGKGEEGGRPGKRGITLVQNVSIDFIRIGWGTRPL